MESRDPVKKIAKCAEEGNDLLMMKIIESDGFIEHAVYHNGCGKNDRYLSSKCDIRNAFLCRNRSS
jgi:hypothetical protein